MNGRRRTDDVGEGYVRKEKGSITVMGDKSKLIMMKDAESKTTRDKETQPFWRTDRQLQTLVQAIPDIVYFKDVEGRNLIVNKAFERLVGLRREEIIGKRDQDLFPPDLAKQY